MEKVDHELLMQLAPENYELRRLYDQHLQLEERLKEFERFPPHTPDAHIKEKTLKKQKLNGMDSIMQILSAYRVDDESMMSMQ